MRSILFAIAAFLFLAVTATAHADSAFTYSFSGTNISGSGGFTITGSATPNAFLVTSIKGQVNGQTINTLLPTGTFHNNDNLFYNSDTYLDDQGVAFSLANGADVAIYYSNEDWFFIGDGNFTLDSGGTQPAGSTPMRLARFAFAPQADIAQTPEPSSFLLLGTGLVGAAASFRRRVRR